jgi:hypothetical protein
MLSNENILLILLLVSTLVIIMHYRTSIEPFTSPSQNKEVLTQEIVDNTLADIKMGIDNLERVYNKEDSKKISKFPEYLELINKKLEEMQVRMNKVASTKSSIAIDKIAKLKNKLSYLNKETDKLKAIQSPKTIKSLQNGLNLSVLGTDNGNYLIAVNGGCLKVASNGSYDIVKCNPNDQSEQFKIIRVYDIIGYNKELHPNDKVRGDDDIKYPFAVVKSINTGNYLKNYFGKLSVEPLIVSKGQRWKLLETSMKCNK